MARGRFTVLVSPAGHLTALPADPGAQPTGTESGLYGSWVPLLKVNRPISQSRVRAAFGWATARFGL